MSAGFIDLVTSFSTELLETFTPEDLFKRTCFWFNGYFLIIPLQVEAE